MSVIIIVATIVLVALGILGMHGNRIQKKYESNTLQLLKEQGAVFSKQTKTDYGIIAVDESNRKLHIINSDITKQHNVVISFEDIYGCELIVDGEPVFKKSAMRTIGGALVGGAMLGGVGAVVGGLSGSYKQKTNVRKVELKIVVRSISASNYRFAFFAEGTNKTFLSMRMQQAEDWKDIVSVIIDDVDNRAKSL